MKKYDNDKVLDLIKNLINERAPTHLDQTKQADFIVYAQYSNATGFRQRFKLFRNANIRFAIVVILIILLSATTVLAFTTDLFQSHIFDLGIKSAVSDGNVNENAVTAKSNGITVEISGTVSDHNRTVFEVKIYGLDKVVDEPILFSKIKLTDADGNEYRFHRAGAAGLATDRKSKGKAVVNSLEFFGGPGKDTTLYLSFDGINGVDGIWKFEIPIQYFESKVYTANLKYENEDESWIINKVSVYASGVVIEGVIEKTKNWNFYTKLSDQQNVYKVYHVSVSDRTVPATFKFEFEPFQIKQNIQLYVMNLDNQASDKYRAIIDIPFERLQEVIAEE